MRRRPLRYIGFDGTGKQVRDAFHPRDLAALLDTQMRTERTGGRRIYNVGGGVRNAMSLAQLTAWCDARFGRHAPESDLRERPYDIPWMAMDSRLAEDDFGWSVETPLEELLEEIACHAEQHPEWLERSGYDAGVMKPALRIGMLQIDTTAGDLEGNAALIVRGARAAAEQGAELVVTPELALMGYLPRDLLMSQGFVERAFRTLERMAAELRAAPALLVGLATMNPADIGRPLVQQRRPGARRRGGPALSQDPASHLRCV